MKLPQVKQEYCNKEIQRRVIESEWAEFAVLVSNQVVLIFNASYHQEIEN